MDKKDAVRPRLIEFFERRKEWYPLAEAARLLGEQPVSLASRALTRGFDTTARGGEAGFSWSELAMVFLDRYSIGTIEHLLGDHAGVLPSLLRGRKLCVMVPEYQVILARRIARRRGVRLDDVVEQGLASLESEPEDNILRRTLSGYAAATSFPSEE